MSFWGKHFSRHYFDRHFDREQNLFIFGPGPGLPTIPPVLPAGSTGVALLAASLEAGLVVTYSWETTVFKAWDGTEVRVENISLPRETYSGACLMIGATLRRQRAIMKRYAHQGLAVRLGLVYDDISVVDDTDASGFVVPTGSTAGKDWMNPGQRVVVFSPDDEMFVESYVQTYGAESVILANDVSSVARFGARIVPLMPTFLADKQGFSRYANSLANAVERWSLSGRAAQVGYVSSTTKAVLACADVIPTFGSDHAMDTAAYVAKIPGADGNTIQVSQDGSYAAVAVVENTVTRTVDIRYKAGVSTLFQIQHAIALFSTLVTFTYTASGATKPGLNDGFSRTHLHGGVGVPVPTFGRDETVTTYDGVPVWDRQISVSDSTSDSIQSLTQLLDLGGVPATFGSAKTSDWGRQISLTGRIGTEEQWIKAFWGAVRGGQLGFWLPSWRADMVPLAVTGSVAAVHASLSLVVAQSGGSGAWAGATVTALSADAAVGNQIIIQVQPGGGSSTGTYYETAFGDAHTITIQYLQGFTTLQNLIDLVAANSTLISISGGTPTAHIQWIDQFGYTQLEGGVTQVSTSFYVDSEDDVMAWRPDYDRLQIIQEDGTITYVRVLVTADDGTETRFDIDEALSSSPISLVSWLEYCRFEKPQYSMRFDANNFTFNEQARVVQR